MSTPWLPTLLLIPLTLALLGGSVTSAHDDRDRDDRDRDHGVERFATLPKDGPGFPEGIAADRAGNIYVATFDFTKTNNIYVFRRDGRLRTTIPVPGVVPLGLEFSAGGDLYVADFLNGNVLKLEPPFTAKSTPAATVSVCGGVPAGCGLNAITFDAAGNLYVSDSFGGRVFKIALPAGTVSTFVADELLKPGSHGFPPFGANGLAFNKAGTHLVIANTADDRIVKFEVATGTLATLAQGLNGADGIAFDSRGRLWVCNNQQDELVALNANGRIIERRGSFRGIGPDGAPKGLLFPASLVISRGDIYVTNLALPLTNEPGQEGDEPEEDVTTFTVSRIELD
jgi:sugar lactone lactonase YvrE